MSADLWAAFGDGESTGNPWTQQGTGTEPAPSSTSSILGARTQPVQQQVIESDPWAAFESKTVAPRPAAPADEWSAFESATVPSVEQTVSPGNDRDEWSAFETGAEVRSGNAGQENVFDDAGVMWDADAAMDGDGYDSVLGPRETDFSNKTTKPGSSLVDVSGLDIGGQEEDEDDEDDFGDFEQAEVAPGQTVPTSVKSTTLAVPTEASRPTATASTAILQNRIDTRGVGADSLIFGATQKTKAQDLQTRSSIPQSATARANRARTISAADKAKPLPPPPPPGPPTPLIDQDDDESFDDWDDFGSAPTTPQQAASTAAKASSLLTGVKGASSAVSNTNGSNFPSRNASQNTTMVRNMQSALPPSNIPPPSIILSHLASVAVPAFAQPSAQTSPNATLRTAAHVLAGRKHRWKRDTHLAQSMSISAAAPGLKSGMKLAGVDRAESTREEREAAELVRVFKAKAGALRASASRAGEKGAVELRDGAPIRVEKNERGMAPAPGKPCVICGLRRAERVAGVDAEVYDGFGEWWIEHWGHRECKEWWEQEESGLRGR